MNVVHTKKEVRRIVSRWRKQGQRVALVPTMGALHEGHLTLVRQAAGHADQVVVSLFVNPTQFGPGEDFERYPRSRETDLALCKKEGIALVFAPDFQEMYGTPDGSGELFLTFRIKKMNEQLCGPFRPGHFEGVLQVVNKLFNIATPDVAVFGQKDIQQWYIIKRMVDEMDIPVEILMGPTQREPDGLARSSRNVYLSAEEREKAPMLHESLQRVAHHLKELLRTSKLEGENAPPDLPLEGENAPPDLPLEGGATPLFDDPSPRPVYINGAIISEEMNRLDENGFKVEYFSVVTTPDLQPTDHIMPGQTLVIAVAARLGKTRLIDNVLFSHKDLHHHDA
ncbi:MAG: pantoate--beta-alanine ligase [Cyclonatronaceae bacterium]